MPTPVPTPSPRTVAYVNDVVFDFDERTASLSGERASGVADLRLVSRHLVDSRFLVARGDGFGTLRTLTVSPGTGHLAIASEIRLPSGRQFEYGTIVAGRTIFAHSSSSTGSGSHSLGTYVVSETAGEISNGALEATASLLPGNLVAHSSGRWVFAGLPDPGVAKPESRIGAVEVLQGGNWVLRDHVVHRGVRAGMIATDPDGRHLYSLQDGSAQNQGTIAVFRFDETTARLSLLSDGIPPELRRFQLDGAAVDPTGDFIAIATRRFREDTSILASEIHILRIERGASISFRHVDGFVQGPWDGDLGLFWSIEGRFLFCRDGIFALGLDGRFSVHGTETRRLNLVRIPGIG